VVTAVKKVKSDARRGKAGSDSSAGVIERRTRTFHGAALAAAAARRKSMNKEELVAGSARALRLRERRVVLAASDGAGHPRTPTAAHAPGRPRPRGRPRKNTVAAARRAAAHVVRRKKEKAEDVEAAAASLPAPATPEGPKAKSASRSRKTRTVSFEDMPATSRPEVAALQMTQWTWMPTAYKRMHHTETSVPNSRYTRLRFRLVPGTSNILDFGVEDGDDDDPSNLTMLSTNLAARVSRDDEFVFGWEGRVNFDAFGLREFVSDLDVLEAIPMQIYELIFEGRERQRRSAWEVASSSALVAETARRGGQVFNTHFFQELEYDTVRFMFKYNSTAKVVKWGIKVGNSFISVRLGAQS